MSKYIPPKAGSKPKMIIIMPIVNSIAGNNPQQIRNRIINPPKIAIYTAPFFSLLEFKRVLYSYYFSDKANQPICTTCFSLSFEYIVQRSLILIFQKLSEPFTLDLFFLL